MPLEELAFDHNVFNSRHSADDKLYVRFFTDVMPAGVENGIKKFKDETLITIMVPGNKRNVTTRIARPEDIERFGKAYEAFKAGQEDPIDGTPLKEWAAVQSPALLEELRYMGFRTVEHVAKASDAACSNYPGLRMLKQRAERWLAIQNEKAPAVELETKLTAAEEQLAAMKQQMEEMAKVMRQLQQKAA